MPQRPVYVCPYRCGVGMSYIESTCTGPIGEEHPRIEMERFEAEVNRNLGLSEDRCWSFIECSDVEWCRDSGECRRALDRVAKIREEGTRESADPDAPIFDLPDMDYELREGLRGSEPCIRCGNPLDGAYGHGPGFCLVLGAVQETKLGSVCPDGGTCHHECEGTCFRVRACGPLSAAHYPDDDWPLSIRVVYGGQDA